MDYSRIKVLTVAVVVGVVGVFAQGLDAQRNPEQWTLAKIDAAFAKFTNYIVLKQTQFFKNNGRYWQGVRSTTDIPKKGELVSPNSLNSKAPGEKLSWSDLQFPTNFTYSQVEITQYAADGFRLTELPDGAIATNFFTVILTNSEPQFDNSGNIIATNVVYTTNWYDPTKAGFVVTLRAQPVSNTWVRSWNYGPEEWRTTTWQKAIVR